MLHDAYTTPSDNTKPLPRDGSPTFGAPTPEDSARSWLRHVEAGRFCQPTATLHEAGGAGLTPENLRTIERNEALMFGRGV